MFSVIARHGVPRQSHELSTSYGIASHAPFVTLGTSAHRNENMDILQSFLHGFCYLKNLMKGKSIKPTVVFLTARLPCRNAQFPDGNPRVCACGIHRF